MVYQLSVNRMIKEAQGIQRTVANLVKGLSTRNRDIIARRFGLQTGKRETLESIGKSYGITRERVRQIEESTIAHLAKAFGENKEAARCATAVKNILHREGGMMSENSLFRAFSSNERYTSANANLVFLLSLTNQVSRSEENEKFHAFWSVSPEQAQAVQRTIVSLVTAMEKKGSPVSRHDLRSLILEGGVHISNGSELSDKHLITLLTLSKEIHTSIFGEFGLISWPEIRPKGVRDKAYLILKRERKPRHFREIAKLINTAGFANKRDVNTQTVHNELIKDDRFVLVGRGMYALAEWGYKAGTVKDVLVDVLRGTQGPLTRSELVAKVLNARFVKENTIVLNLQDSKVFVKNEDGTYDLRKA